MNAPATDLPPARVTPNLGHAFGGIWRLTMRRFFTTSYWLLLGGGLALLVVLALASNHDSGHDAVQTHGFLKWVVDFYLAFLLPIIVFIMSAGALRDELRPDSVDYIFTRPVPRPAFIIGKFIAQVACFQFEYLLAFIALLGVGLYQHMPALFALVPQLLLAQFLLVTVFSAFGFLFGMLTSRYVVAGLTYGLIVEIGVGQIPTQLNRFSMIHQARMMFPAVVFPMDTVVLPPAVSALTATLILLGMTLFLLTATAIVFHLKELAGAQGKET